MKINDTCLDTLMQIKNVAALLKGACSIGLAFFDLDDKLWKGDLFLPICALKEVFGNARKTACTSPMAQSLLVNPMFDHGSSRHFIP